MMKIGIIGCGSITRHRHAPEYTANPHVSEVVYYDRNPERADAMAADFDGTAVHTVEALFNDPDITAISDCSSNESHATFSTEALKKGKHVLCEKPIALTLEDAQMIIDAQQTSGKRFMPAHNQRLSAAHQQAKLITDSGQLGDVLTFNTTYGHQGPEYWSFNNTNSTWFFKKERSGLGVAGDLGIHKIDLIHYLLDDVITEVSAFDATLDKQNEHGESIDVCDNIVSSLKTNRGILGSASFSWTYYGEEDNSTTLYCKHGMLKIYPDQLDVIKRDGENVRWQPEDLPASTSVVDAFIDAIRFDEVPVVTGQDGYASLRVVLGMLEAARTGVVVSV